MLQIHEVAWDSRDTESLDNLVSSRYEYKYAEVRTFQGSALEIAIFYSFIGILNLPAFIAGVILCFTRSFRNFSVEFTLLAFKSRCHKWMD